MNRRDYVKAALAVPWLAGMSVRRGIAGSTAGARGASRVRPGEAGWPSTAEWERLNRDVAGRLVRVTSPFGACAGAQAGAGAGAAAARDSAACAEALAQLKNPFYLGDQVGLTQTSGWLDAWTSRPSVYAVAARTTADVVAAVNFARVHNLRLVVKGGGHSYQGTSNAADSLLIWTRAMNQVVLEEAFVAQGCEGVQAALPAVTVGAGALWSDAYDAVTTRGRRYVQGGGCTTVGVAGLVQSGGFGSFSKQFGTAAGGLLEAEVVTADGRVLIANACTHADLFWGLKGGGGSSLGVITRMKLRTHPLPETFGSVTAAIAAGSDGAFRALVAEMLSFYSRALFNPHWGEQVHFSGDNTLRLAMVFQGLSQAEAEATWAPFFAWVRARPAYRFSEDARVLSLPAEHFWDAEFFRLHAPGLIVADDRPGAPRHHVLWAGDQAQAGWFLHGYRSAWLPASLLQPGGQAVLVDAVFAATRDWSVGFHFNKGLAGAPAEARALAKDTAMHPGVLDAFALAIIADGGPPAFPGMGGARADSSAARETAERIGTAMGKLLQAAPGAGSYLSESDYFEARWQTSFWGAHHARLAAVKRRHDPAGLFFAHHGVGSESWSADGFTRLPRSG